MKRTPVFIILLLMLLFLLLAMSSCGKTTYACNHPFSIEQITIEPTCEEEGILTHICDICGEELSQESIPSLGHHEITEEEVPPTCTSAGRAYVFCSICDLSWLEIIPALGHNEISHEAKAPTCTEIGWDAYVTCSRCDYTTYTEQEARGHSYSEIVTKPTCTEKGYTTYVCDCGDEHINLYTDPLGHSEIIDEAKAPTCTESGLTEGKHCSVCNYIIIPQEILPAKHTEVTEDAVAPTCTESGLSEGKYCSICNKILVAQEIVSPLGHDYSESWTVDLEPTLESVGSRSHHCTRCEEKTESAEIPMLPYSDGLEYMLSNDGSYYAITGIGIFKGKELIIPPIYNGIPVTVINSKAFENCTELTHIEAPSSITAIGDYAFNGCSKLQSINLSNGTNAIGYGIFMGCDSLTTITMSWEGLEYDHFRLLFGGTSFDNNIPESLSTVVITNGDSIGYGAFMDVQLDKIYIPASISVIGANAFRGCGDLTIYCQATSTPNEWDKLWNFDGNYVYWDYAMEGEESLEYTYNSSKKCYTVSGIGNFTGSVLTIPAGYNFLPITGIDENAFSGCTQLTEFISSRNLHIGKGAFSDCCNLANVEINSAISIGLGAFENCDSLVSITIPFVGEAMTTVGCTHFGYIFGANSSANNKAFVPKSLKSVVINTDYAITYRAFEGCNGLESISFTNIQDISIGNHAFTGCTSLTRISILGGSLSIGEQAFEGCNNLSEICVKDVYTWCSIDGLKNIMCFGADNKAFYLDNLPVTEITIPDAVRDIPDYAFYKFSNITDVLMPYTVYSIGAFAFAECGSLYKIVIPTTVQSIGKSAFYQCDTLTNISLPFIGATRNGTENTHFGYIFGAGKSSYNSSYVPASLISVTITNATSIADEAFADCDSIAYVEIPRSVVTIGANAFYSCSSLTTVTIDEGVTSIGDNAFKNCTSLFSIIIPNSVTTLGNSAFYGCDGLTSATIGTAVESLGNDVFYGCIELTGITIPANIKSLGTNAFAYCTGLTSINIEYGLITIGDFAFGKCSGLTSITLPQSVTSIGWNAFRACSGLTTIYVPERVTYIGYYAFYECTGLESITIPFIGTTKGGADVGNDNLFGSIFGADSPSNVSSYVPKSLKKVTVTVSCDVWDAAFSGCNNLTEIILPSGVTKIGESAFEGCTSLTSFTMPSQLKAIGAYAFMKCSSLKSITVHNGVTTIGESAFANCKSLTSITLPFVGTTSSYNGAFDSSFHSLFGGNCGESSVIPVSLKTVIINGGTIQQYAFADCTGIECVTLNTSSIGSLAFSGCSNLKTVTLGIGVKSISNLAFEYCTNITTINYRGNEGQWENNMSRESGWDTDLGNYTLVFKYSE